MPELSPKFGLVQKGQEKSAAAGRESCTGRSLEIPHCSTLLPLGPTGFGSLHSV